MFTTFLSTRGDMIQKFAYPIVSLCRKHEDMKAIIADFDIDAHCPHSVSSKVAGPSQRADGRLQNCVE